MVAGFAAPVQAQTATTKTVPFIEGAIGTRSTNSNEANVVKTFTELGIDRVLFSQTSAGAFYVEQGNDVLGTLTIVGTNGTTLTFDAAVNWKKGFNGNLAIFGILPLNTTPITWTGGTSSVTLTDGRVPNGTSIAAYVNTYGGPFLTSGASQQGEASKPLSDLNAYLGLVNAGRPAGPVSVTAATGITPNTTFSITGGVTLDASKNEALTVIVNGVQYAAPQVVVSGNTWSLQIAGGLPAGTYSVSATITNPTTGYTLTDGTTGELSVGGGATPITISGGAFTAFSKTYDGTTTAIIDQNTLSISGSPSGVSIGTVTLAFETASAGENKKVVITGFTLAGPNANSYTPDITGAPEYLSGIITKAPLTITGVNAIDKVYNGTTAAALTGTAAYSGLVNSESFQVTGTGSGTFADADVGTDKAVTVAGYTTPSANYLLTQPAGLKANITAAPLTITVTAQNKEYDGSTTASLNTATYNGLQNGQTFPVSGTPLATFDTKNVGTSKVITVSGYTAPNGNYTVTQPTNVTANITPKELKIGGSFIANNKPFDGGATATIATNSLTLTGLISGDVGNVTLTGLAAAFADAAVGTGKTVSLTAASLTGDASTNYTVTRTDAPTTTASITSVALNISGSFTALDKVYDATTTATGNTAGLVITGTPAGVNLASVTLVFENATAGTGKVVSIAGVTLGGAQAANYSVNLVGSPTARAAIFPRPVRITGSFTAADKIFDGNTSARILTRDLRVTGTLNGDILSVGEAIATFGSADIGNGKTVSLIAAALLGANAGNYRVSLEGAPTTTASILPLTPPGPVRNLRGTAGDQRLSISFDIPETEGCSPISSYVVEYSANNGATWTRIVTTSRTLDIAPVVNNITYRVRVAAVNSCGQGPWTEIGDLVPFAPVRKGDGDLPVVPTGTVTVSPDAPTTIEVVKDTVLRVTGPGYTISVRSTDVTGAPMPVAGLTLQLEQGGNASTEGTGFGPGTWVTLYIYGVDKQPRFLGRVLVRADGSFATSFPIPADLPEGPYTLQVNGVDAQGRARNAALGVEVVEPTPDLIFTAVPNRTDMVVGDTVTFTLTVQNIGRGPAIDVVIPRAFDEPGFRFVSATPVDGRFDVATTTWTIPRIERTATARLTLRAIVLSPIPAPTPSPESNGGSTR